jgi:signal transduction histidine kinase/ligand-binding sensor domain-containing protein
MNHRDPSPHWFDSLRGCWRWSLLALIFVPAASLALPPDRAISQYVRRSWTVEKGLPHGTVRGIAQTADGYLWFATYEGVVRFNGERLRIFDKASTSGIPNSSVMSIFRDHSGTLWLGTAAGVTRYDGHEFAMPPHPQGDETVINGFAQTSDGTIWIGSGGNGLSRIENGRIVKVPMALPSKVINALSASGDTLWIGTAGGGVTSLRSGQAETFNTANGLSDNTVVALLSDGDGVLVGTGGGLDRIERGVVTRVAGLPRDQITALRRDRDRNLWVGTYSHGLFRISSTGAIARFGIEEGLLNPTIRAIFEDGDGSIWVGSNRGVEQLRNGTFVTWGKAEGIADDFTRTVFEDHDHTLWVGTAHGLFWRDGETWKPIDHPQLAGEYVLAIAQTADGTRWFGTSHGLYRVNATTRLYTTADGLSHNTIRAIREDSRHHLWIATDAGLNRILPDGRIENLSLDGRLGTDYAIGVTETADGRIWIATGGGLAEYDGQRFTLHSAPQTFPSNRLFAIHGDADGTLWIGTDGDGLIRYRKGAVRAITTRNGLPNDKVLSIADDGKGHLWFGTTRGPFKAAKTDLNAIADGRTERLVAALYDESDGLGSRQCNGSGDPSALRASDGSIWFATAKGVARLAAVDGQAPVVRARAPVIERVLVDGKVAAPAMVAAILPGAERVEFEFSGVDFATPERLRFRYRVDGYEDRWSEAGSNRIASYTNLPAGKYRFLLESTVDGQAWQSASLPFAVKPHFYETTLFIALALLVIAALLLGIHRARLHIARERARLLETLVDERTRQISEEKARTEVALREAEAAKREAEYHEKVTEQALADAEEANRTKSIFLATTSHELRTPLNAIIGFSEIIATRAGDQLSPRYMTFIHNIHSSGEYLLGIINNILDLSKIEAGKMEMRPETIDIRESVSAICDVMKGVTTLRRITIELNIPRDIPKFEADPSQFKQIVYNLMSNAVKFSPEGSTVTITARHLWPPDSPIGENAVELRVIDRGIGIDPKDQQLIFQEFRQAPGLRGQRPEGTGLGLALVKRFIEMHRGAVALDSEPGKGSTFIVTLPCRNQAVAVPSEPLRDPAAL